MGKTRNKIGFKIPKNSSEIRKSSVESVDNILDLAFNKGSSVVSTEDAYNTFVWVNASVGLIARSISAIPLEFNLESARGLPRKIPMSDPVSRLFRNPNYEMSGSDLWDLSLVYYKTYGEVFWVVPRKNITEVPEAIYVANPKNFYVNLHPTTNAVISYTYMSSSNMEFLGHDMKPGKTLAPHEIIHFKTVNPKDTSRGLAPSKILAGKLGLDKYSEEFNMNFFLQGAKVDGFIESEDEIPDEEMKRLKNNINNIHSGSKNAHKIGILESGMKFKESKITQKDMDFISMKKMIREEIFSIYGTNSIVLGLYEDVKSYEGIKAAHKIFWEDTLIPLCVYFENQVYDKLLFDCAPLYTPKFATYTVGVLKEDFNKKVEAAERLCHIGYTINEVNRRLDLGLAEMPWGDEWWGAGSNTNIIEQFNKKIEQTEQQQQTILDNNDVVTEEEKKPKEEAEEVKPEKKLTKENSLLISKIKRFVFEDRSDTLMCYHLGKEKDISKHLTNFNKIVLPVLSETVKEETHKNKIYELFKSYAEKAKKITSLSTKKENIDFLVKKHYNDINVYEILNEILCEE